MDRGKAQFLFPFFLAVPVYWFVFGREYFRVDGTWVSSLLALSLAGAVLSLGERFPGFRGKAFLSLVLRALLLTLVAGIGATLLSRSLEMAKTYAAVLSDPLAVNRVEGAQVLRAWMITSGRDIYTDLSGYPYIATVYMPLYYVISALASKVAAPLLAARLVSPAGCAVAMGAVAFLVRRETKSLLAALFAPLFIFQVQYFMDYGMYARVDMAAWGLAFVAALFAALGCERSRRGNACLAVSAVFAVLAVFTKQQMFPFALVCGPYAAVVRREIKPVVVWNILPGLGLGLVLFLLAKTLAGDAFLLNVFEYPRAMAADPALNSVAAMKERLAYFCGKAWPLMVLYGLHLASLPFVRRFPLPDVLFLVQAPLFVLALRWWGGDSNYYIGPVLFMSFGAAVFLRRLSRLGNPAPFLACAAILFLVPSKMNVAHELRGLAAFHAETAKQEREARDVAALIDAAQGPVLVEAEAGYLALTPKAAFFDGVECTNMSRYGLWRYRGSQLAADIAGRRFPLILNGSTFVPAEMSAAVDANYEKTATLAGIGVYSPRTFDARFSVTALPWAGEKASGASMRMVAWENLAPVQGEDCVAPQDPAKPGRLILEVLAENPVRAASLLFYPRVDSGDPNASLVLSWSQDGMSHTPLYTLAGRGAHGWTPAFEPAQSPVVSAKGGRVFFRFELSGKAQLWFSKNRPMFFWTSFKE